MLTIRQIEGIMHYRISAKSLICRFKIIYKVNQKFGYLQFEKVLVKARPLHSPTLRKWHT